MKIPAIEQADISLDQIDHTEKTLWVSSPSVVAQCRELQNKRCEIVLNATWNDVKKLWHAIRDFCPEQVVAIGGGKVLDVAKLAARLSSIDDTTLLLLQKRKIPEHLWHNKTALQLIPTTAGSGSEASAIAVLSYEEHKYPIHHEILYADKVYLLPWLLADLPKEIKNNGLWDALVHSIESAVSPIKTPFSAELSYCAAQKIFMQIQNPNDWDCKMQTEIQWSAFCAGVAQGAASVGLVHALAHTLESKTGKRHGELVAHMLVPVMELHLEKKPALYDILIQHLQLSSADTLLKILNECSERDWGEWQRLTLTSEEQRKLIDTIVTDPCIKTNPVFLTKVQLLEWLQRWCFEH